jgi:hypothetical protein
MLLHGTNTPLPLGTILTSSQSRGTDTLWSNSRTNAVYFTDTDYQVPDGEEDYVSRMTEEELPGDEATTKSQRALASAIYYGVGGASRKIHPLSQSLAYTSTDLLQDEFGEPHEQSSSMMTDDDVDRIRFNRRANGLPTNGFLKESEWEALPVDEQNQFNDKYGQTEDLVEPEELRGYWVYEVEIVRGSEQRDTTGRHWSDNYIRNGQLRVKGVIIADGAMVDDAIPYPPTKARIPVANGKEMELIHDLTERVEQRRSENVPTGRAANLPVTSNGPAQCGARTADSSSCRRTTASGGRCWQHQVSVA